MDETDKHLEQLAEAVKTKEALQALLRSEGWDILRAILKDRHASLLNEVMYNCLDDTRSVYRQEYMKGQAYMIQFLLNMPGTLKEEAEAVVDTLPQAEDDVDAD